MAKTKPMLWMKSSVYFEFLRRRLDGLVEVQSELHRRSPENYGVLSGVVSYMLQSVLSTPARVEGYVREALRNVHYYQVMDRFGMFFLHDLDTEAADILPEVRSEDTMEIKRIVGAGKQKVGMGRMEWTGGVVVYGRGVRMAADGAVEVTEGRKKVSWVELTRLMDEEPWEVVSKYRWNARLEEYKTAGRQTVAGMAGVLFQLFTEQIWGTVNVERLVGTEILAANVEKALEYWTLDFVWMEVKWKRLFPWNCPPMHGAIPGMKMSTFQNLVSMYFPGEKVPMGDGVWKQLSEFGYIYTYREIVKRLDEGEGEDLRMHLGRLLSECQCLPWSRRTAEGKGGPWMVEKGNLMMAVNPEYYMVSPRILANAERKGRGADSRSTRAHGGKGVVRGKVGLLNLKARVILDMEKWGDLNWVEMEKAAQGHGWNQVQVEKKLRAQERLNTKYKRQRQSGRKKNSRKPPIGKKRHGLTAAAEDDDSVEGLEEDERKAEEEDALGEDDDLCSDDEPLGEDDDLFGDEEELDLDVGQEWD